MDLSIVIPGRHEMFFRRTVEDVLAHTGRQTEVIAIVDGATCSSHPHANPPLPDDPRLRVERLDTVIGQRAATNLGVRMSRGRYVCKLDAHCSIDDGFDAKVVAAGDELGHDVTQIPRMFNLHAFNWKCEGCGAETYQGPTPTLCETCAKTAHVPGGPFVRKMLWAARENRKTDFARFDHTLHFQYWPECGKRPESKGEIADVLSSVGACFVMRRARFDELGGLDETHGSWGQFGVEIACKSWLSGGRQVVNKRTWFAHMFRTQGGDFGFPYRISGADQERARKYSRDLWLHNRWPGQVRPLSWLIDKFAPITGWHGPEGAEALAQVQEAGREWSATHTETSGGGAMATVSTGTVPPSASAGDAGSAPRITSPAVIAGSSSAGTARATLPILPGAKWAVSADRAVSKGIIYYTDNRTPPAIREAVARQIDAAGLPVVAAVLPGGVTPAHWTTVTVDAERGYLTMFRQILAALEASTADVIYHCEHDVLYHQSHFEFTPPRADTFYYNQHTFKVDAQTGQALFYYCSQVSGLCASRDLLVDHYRKRVALVAEHGFSRELGFEPGTNKAQRSFETRTAETWLSPWPNVDVRHGANLTRSRWSQDQFRNKSTCQGWMLVDEVPGWGVTKGRFAAFLADLAGKRAA